jgi:hypothetical protein
MNKDTQGWLILYEVKGQCGTCSNVLKDGNMVACFQSRPNFGNAHNCPVYAYNWKDEK